MEYCGRQGRLAFAGVHLIVELWNAQYMDHPQALRRVIQDMANACGATLLSLDLHVFSPNGGVSGVAVLQESHISIHTWPEFEYAAMDIFVCGTLDPYKCIPTLKEHLRPGKINIMEIKRGIMDQ